MDEARRVVEDRRKVYGSPLPNHQRIANLWSAYLETDIEPHQAAMCMALVKVARLIESPDHHDSIVDYHGYGDVYAAIRREVASEPIFSDSLAKRVGRLKSDIAAHDAEQKREPVYCTQHTRLTEKCLDPLCPIHGDRMPAETPAKACTCPEFAPEADAHCPIHGVV